MNKITQLLEHGQSYWLDNLSREMLDSGDLKMRVEKQGLRGVTSNPKTFATSVQATDKYDDDIKRLKKEGKDIETIYEALMIDDVQRGCDELRKVYDESSGEDGFVSIEVDPRLARHTQATLTAARHLWKSVDRPNCMVKIPGTAEGLEAIETALTEGINVNITLLFSLGRYREVVSAYQRAMQKRFEAKEPLAKVASVASFFLSRIDVLVDELLDHRILSGESDSTAKSLKGKAAIASCRMVYDEFLKRFSSDEWKSVRSAGAHVQRPLWASTSTKNPDYSKTMYVDPLIAKDTVNTMPEKTIDAFENSGTVKADAIASLSGDPRNIMQSIENQGIHWDYIHQRLEDEGLQKFIEPFQEGIQSISKIAPLN